MLADDGVRERRTRVALDSKGSILGFASYLISGNVAVGRIAPHLSSTKHQTVITTLPVAIAAEWMAISVNFVVFGDEKFTENVKSGPSPCSEICRSARLNP